MQPEDLAKSGSEASMQSALFCWAALADVRLRYPELAWMFAIPNGGSRNKIEGARFKSGGVKAGVPDIMLPVKRHSYAGLFIELKKDQAAYEAWRKLAEKGETEQKKWLDYLYHAGYSSVVCIGWEQARDCIIWYMNGER